MTNDESVRHSDGLIVYSFLMVMALFLIFISLPAVLLTIIFTSILVNLKKIKKIYFCIVSLVLAIVVNTKISFMKQFVLNAESFLKIISKDILHKSNLISPLYKNYLAHINIIWQVLIALVLSSIIAEIYYIKTKESITNEPDKRKEKVINKYLEKIRGQAHDEMTTTIGADYKNIQKVKINDNAKHIIVAGTTGAGKTVSIANFIESAMQKGYPVFAIDGKGDLGPGSMLNYMQSLSKKNNRKLYVVNFVDPANSDYYNPFKDAGMTEAKDMLIGMNHWSEEHYKVNTERYLQQLIKILNIKKIPLDLNTIIKYSPTKFQKLIEEMKMNGEIDVEDFTKITDIIENTAAIVNSAMARFATTAESEASEIFNSNGIDVYTAIKEKANILIVLDPLGKPELSKQVGRLAILDAKKAVSKLFLDKTRKYFIFDEFNVYASDSAIDLLNKSRSANVTCIPAFQSLSDLDKAGGVAFRNQVIENCNNYIIMRQNSYDSSAEWQRVVGQEETINYNYSIENAGLFGTKPVSNGKGSMHKTMESKHTYTDIQNLEPGQAIIISKDQKIDTKVKMRSIKIDDIHKERRNNIKMDPKGIEKFGKPIDIGLEEPTDRELESIEPKQNQKTMDDVMNLLK